ncbi:MAG: hypothetical protein PHD67_06530 [Oscillospiraceae bacterium]|nr:hypothetical protein [Oscillospiraceae bacterium]
MTKGKYGIAPAAVAALAFVFAILDMPLAGVLLMAYAVLAEKDEWLIRQTLQALILSLASSILQMLIGAVFVTLAGAVDQWFYDFSSVLYGVNNVLCNLVSILVFILAILGIIKAIKGSDTGIPLLNGLAAKATGAVIASAKPAKAPAPAPAAPVAPEAPAAPVAEGWTCSCGKVNGEGQFCMQCGKPRA